MSRDARRLILALVIGVCATYAVLSINLSPLTPGSCSDSVEYLGAAKSLARTGTLAVPLASWASSDSVSTLAHYPPGFPALVALPISLGVRSYPSALWVMAASSGVALAFAFLIVASAFGDWAGVLAALLLFLTPTYAKIDMAIWSEPSYLALTLPMFYLMLKKPRWAIGYGLLAAAALSVRYVGIAGSALVVLWAAMHGRSVRDRLTGAAIAGTPSLLFLAWWHSYVAAAGTAIRHVGPYFSMLHANLTELAQLGPLWLVPMSWPGGELTALLLATLGVLVILAAWRTGEWWASTRKELALLGSLYAVLYVAVVVGSRLFADPAIPFDARLFLPVLVLATMAAAASAYALGKHPHTTVMNLALVLLLGAWMQGSWSEIQQGVRTVNHVGRFYSSIDWIDSPAIRWIDNHSRPYDVIYSNEPELVYYQTGRYARTLPRTGENLAAFRTVFFRHHAALVIAYPLNIGDLPARTFVALLGLKAAVRTPLATVYVASHYATRLPTAHSGRAAGAP